MTATGGEKALVDRLVLRVIRNASVRFTALRAGDVDLIERPPYEWVKQIRAGRLKGLRLAEASEAGWRRVLFNVADPPFNDRRLRQAVAHAIKKKEVLHAAYFGFGEPVDQKYPKSHKWYVKGVPSAAYDLDRAKALVKEAGFSGKTVTMVVEQSQTRETEATTLQSQLKKIGIDLKLEMQDRAAHNSQLRKGKFSIVTRGGSVQLDPSPTYAPKFTCPRNMRKRTSNLSGYCDKKMQGLLQQLESELDAGKRTEVFRQIVMQAAEDLPEIPLGFVPRYFAYRDSVKGFVTNTEADWHWMRGGLSRAWVDK